MQDENPVCKLESLLAISFKTLQFLILLTRVTYVSRAMCLALGEKGYNGGFVALNGMNL